MEQTNQPTLAVIYENWRGYQEKLRDAVALLTDENPPLQPAPHMWPLGQILQHIIAVRAGWFSGTLQDEDAAMIDYMEWGHASHRHAAPPNWYAVWRRRAPSKPAYNAGPPTTAPRPSPMNGRPGDLCLAELGDLPCAGT